MEKFYTKYDVKLCKLIDLAIALVFIRYITYFGN